MLHELKADGDAAAGRQCAWRPRLLKRREVRRRAAVAVERGHAGDRVDLRVVRADEPGAVRLALKLRRLVPRAREPLLGLPL